MRGLDRLIAALDARSRPDGLSPPAASAPPDPGKPGDWGAPERWKLGHALRRAAAEATMRPRESAT